MTDVDERHPKLVPMIRSLLLLLPVCLTLVNGRIIKTLSTARNDLQVSVIFPPDVKEGDNVTLTCNYDMKDRLVYSVRWYFNLEEVYRYTETPKRSKKVSQVKGITVDVSSIACKVKEQIIL